MKRIALLSDTHSYLDDSIIKHTENCDEIWHAGDIGNLEVTDKLKSIKPLRAVYGNIDDLNARREFPKDNRFTLEGVDVWMTHIGGYPGKYNPKVLQGLKIMPPKLFICGHSHILKVMYDQQFKLLHMNPGACGQHGFHHMRTMLRFTLDAGEIGNLEVIELGLRGR